MPSQSANPQVLARQAAEAIAATTGIDNHELSIILGSGWSRATRGVGTTVSEIPSADVPGFFGSEVPGHQGKISSVMLQDGRHVLVIGARTHLYEAKGVRAVAHGVRVAAACGAEVTVLTNGAGGINKSWKPGTPVLISDHINLTGASPLEGPTFIDLTDLYSTRLRGIARTVDSTLSEGVYVQFPGPNYETPAEVMMAKTMGGQIVGMSTALEAIAAREAGMEVLGLSLITNHAAGISSQPLSHGEVMDAGEAAEPRINALLGEIVRAL